MVREGLRLSPPAVAAILELLELQDRERRDLRLEDVWHDITPVAGEGRGPASISVLDLSGPKRQGWTPGSKSGPSRVLVTL